MIELACRGNGYILMVTADHGNAEKMYDEKGGKHTAHTCNRGRYCIVLFCTRLTCTVQIHIKMSI